jgi:hypothetical protein
MVAGDGVGVLRADDEGIRGGGDGGARGGGDGRDLRPVDVERDVRAVEGTDHEVPNAGGGEGCGDRADVLDVPLEDVVLGRQTVFVVVRALLENAVVAVGPGRSVNPRNR